jgi:hypothetical protein
MKFSPIQSLWLLVALQAFVLLVLLGGHFSIQSEITRLLNLSGQIQTRVPEVRQKIQEEQNPEKIRSDALTLLDFADDNSRMNTVILADLQKIIDAICLIFFIVTVYLAVCAHKLRRQNQNAADILK